jgi:transposase
MLGAGSGVASVTRSRNRLSELCGGAALKMQMNKTDQNDAEGLAQIMRTRWYRSVHVKSLDAHRTRALLGARAQLVGMTTRLSNHIRGVLKTFGMLPGAGIRQGGAHVGKERPDVPIFDERAWYRGRHRAGLRE